jgi:hypothetical protein
MLANHRFRGGLNLTRDLPTIRCSHHPGCHQELLTELEDTLARSILWRDYVRTIRLECLRVARGQGRRIVVSERQ